MITTRTEEIIRVRFLREETGIEMDGKKIPAKYGRPKRLRKVTIKDENEKVIEVYYTSMLKGSRIVIPESSFITEWEKGPTPQPKRTIERKYNCKDINFVSKYLIKTDYKFDTSKDALSRNQQTRQLLESNKLDIKDICKKVQLSNTKKNAKKAERRAKKNHTHRIKSLHGKPGKVTVQYKRQDGVVLTKTFLAKGIAKNNEFKKILTTCSEILDHRYKCKPGTKDINKAKQIALQQTPEWKEKTKFIRKKRKKLMDEEFKRRWEQRKAFLNRKEQLTE